MENIDVISILLLYFILCLY